MMETASNRAIAEFLDRNDERVTNRKVAGFFERMAETPFESFDGDPSDYWVIIGDKRAYSRYKRRLEQHHE